jgi:hypothetical protein
MWVLTAAKKSLRLNLFLFAVLLVLISLLFGSLPLFVLVKVFPFDVFSLALIYLAAFTFGLSFGVLVSLFYQRTIKKVI